MNFTKIKQEAKTLLNGNFAKILLYIIVPALLAGSLSGFTVNWNNPDQAANPFVTLIISVLQLVVSLMVGYASLQFVKTRDTRYLSLDGLTLIFKKTNVIMNLIIYSLIMGIGGFLSGVIIALLAFIPILGWILLPFAFAGLIILLLMVAMTEYIIMDEELGAWDAIMKSIKLMNGHKMEYFVFGLSFIGWIILTIITFGLAGVWVIPYITIAELIYYFKLKEHQ